MGSLGAASPCCLSADEAATPYLSAAPGAPAADIVAGHVRPEVFEFFSGCAYRVSVLEV